MHACELCRQELVRSISVQENYSERCDISPFQNDGGDEISSKMVYQSVSQLIWNVSSLYVQNMLYNGFIKKGKSKAISLWLNLKGLILILFLQCCSLQTILIHENPCHPNIWLSSVKRWTNRARNTAFQVTHVIRHLSMWENNYFNCCDFIELLSRLPWNIKISYVLFREIWIQNKWLASLLCN